MTTFHDRNCKGCGRLGYWSDHYGDSGDTCKADLNEPSQFAQCDGYVGFCANCKKQITKKNAKEYGCNERALCTECYDLKMLLDKKNLTDKQSKELDETIYTMLYDNSIPSKIDKDGVLKLKSDY